MNYGSTSRGGPYTPTMPPLVVQDAPVTLGEVLPLVVPDRHVDAEPVGEHQHRRPHRSCYVDRQLGAVEGAQASLGAGPFGQPLRGFGVGARPGPAHGDSLDRHGRNRTGRRGRGRDQRRPGRSRRPLAAHDAPTYSRGTRSLRPHTTS